MITDEFYCCSSPSTRAPILIRTRSSPLRHSRTRSLLLPDSLPDVYPSIEIQNTDSNPGKCSNGTNSIQAFPQAQSASSHSPWLDANNSTSNVQYPTVTNGDVGLVASRLAVVAMPILLCLLV